MYCLITRWKRALCFQCLRSQVSKHQQRRFIASTNYFRRAALHGVATTNDKTIREIFDNPEVWLQYSAKRNDPTVKRTGLFHNNDLTSPAGFQKFTDKCLRKVKRLVHKIVNASTREELVQVVQHFDRLSDLLCRVIDMADFVRITHPDRSILDAATSAYAEMYEYMNVLNTTPGLYESLKRILHDKEIMRRLSVEELAVAKNLYNDFEKSGINLPASTRRRWVKLNTEISNLGAQFVNGSSPKAQHLEFESWRMKGMDPLISMELSQTGRIMLPTTGMLASHVLGTVENADVRREVYMACHTSSDEQILVLEQLLKHRAELVKLVNSNSYGHHVLADKMAGTPEAVMEFLHALYAANRPGAQAEVDQISKIKSDLGHLGRLQPWDRQYYIAKRRFGNRLRCKSGHVLSDYFSVGTVMQGLSRLFDRLYGVRFVLREPLPGETWHPDIRCFDVMSETDGHIAVMYCDFFCRDGKTSQPAHFTLRCSRVIPAEEIEEEKLAGEQPNDGMASARDPSTGELFQLPTIALVCDFLCTPPSSKKPSLLGLREVQTLFHEMGHAIHSMLGRTRHQNLAGTRCAADWAELPSILMEHFSKDPQVLRLFAKHYVTGESIPYELLQHHLTEQSFFQASETHFQIILAILDQHYHSTLPYSPTFCSTAVYRDLENRLSLLPHAEGTSYQGLFNHLYSYGATYYSYLFDRAIAAKVWSEVFEKDPVNRECGERYMNEVLKWGGSRSGWACLAGVLKRPDLEQGGEAAMREVGKWGSELK